MTKKRILTVGFELAADEAEYEDFDSKISLLDWDIILFRPEIASFISYGDSYKGRPCLSDRISFQVKDCCEHWRREIKQAIASDKTVIVFLSPHEEVFIDTGDRRYSGTGRNQKTTRLVAEYSNYKSIPTSLFLVASAGTSMKLSTSGADILAAYWREFENVSRYQVILGGQDVPACVLTRTGDKPVGAIYRSKSSTGTLILLPDIDFSPDDFTQEKNDALIWTAAAKQFAKRMLSAIVALDKSLRSQGAITPEPAWASSERFILGTEDALRRRLLAAGLEVERAQKSKETLAEELRSAGALRALLYENGKPLEHAIIKALRILGFTAAPFKDSDSEFDVVFESDEGRLIGEAEGKDNKAINIDKLRQLSMNVHEDLQRDTVTEPAKPVLFGNAFRLQQPAERLDPFTTKCYKAAVSSSTALVSTVDLFWTVQYLVSNEDADFAKMCRESLLSSIGRVTFPSAPVALPSEAELQIDTITGA